MSTQYFMSQYLVRGEVGGVLHCTYTELLPLRSTPSAAAYKYEYFIILILNSYLAAAHLPGAAYKYEYFIVLILNSYLAAAHLPGAAPRRRCRAAAARHLEQSSCTPHTAHVLTSQPARPIYGNQATKTHFGLADRRRSNRDTTKCHTKHALCAAKQTQPPYRNTASPQPCA